MLEKLQEKGFQILALHHSEAILSGDMPDALAHLESAMLSIQIPVEELIRGGGGESEVTQRLRHTLSEVHGWPYHNFEVSRSVDGRLTESSSHELDHVRRFATGTVALEIEWNNKDPFFDRDLDTFKRLHADGAISVGVIATRGESLQAALREVVVAFAKQRGIDSLEKIADYYHPTPRQAALIKKSGQRHGFEEGWARVFVADKFGEATTHWRKLEERVGRGVGNPCPLVLIGIPRQVLVF